MLTLKLIPRISSYVNSSIQKLHTAIILNTSKNDESSSSSDSDSDNEKIKNETKKEDATQMSNAEYLNQLLEKMIKKDYPAKTINVAKSKDSKLKNIAILKRKEREEEYDSIDKKVYKAARNVASLMGGDVSTIEKELLKGKLVTFNVKNNASKNMKDASHEMKNASNDMQDAPNVMKDAPNDMKDAPNDMKDASKTTDDNETQNLMNVILGMNVKELTAESDPIESARIAHAKLYTKVEIRKSTAFREVIKFNLFGNKQKTIFHDLKESNENIPKLSTWDLFEERELKVTLMQPPENYFQEMINLTERGVLWHFPINNEQGLTSEDNVHFSEHVFMEHHLKDWCPKKGPIRHFMELVCVGLSKNAFLTVEEKKDHIMWYKDYFAGKENLLKEIGAVPQEHMFEQTNLIEEKQV